MKVIIKIAIKSTAKNRCFMLFIIVRFRRESQKAQLGYLSRNFELIRVPGKRS